VKEEGKSCIGNGYVTDILWEPCFKSRQTYMMMMQRKKDGYEIHLNKKKSFQTTQSCDCYGPVVLCVILSCFSLILR